MEDLLDVCDSAKSHQEVVTAVQKAKNSGSYRGVMFNYCCGGKSLDERIQLQRLLEPYGRLQMCFSTGWVYFDIVQNKDESEN